MNTEFTNFFSNYYIAEVPGSKTHGWALHGDWLKKHIKGSWVYIGHGEFVFEQEHDRMLFLLKWA